MIAWNKRKWLNISIAGVLKLAPGQFGTCEICQRSEQLCADHDHRTNDTRGAICRRCNAGLGFFDDEPSFLRRAADYVWRHAQQAEREKLATEREEQSAPERQRKRVVACRPKTPLGFKRHGAIARGVVYWNTRFEEATRTAAA